MPRKFKEFIRTYVIISVAYGLFALVLVFPVHPITGLGWIIWFVAALPIAAIGEAIGSALFDRRIGEAINDDTDHVSGGRIAYCIVVAFLLSTTMFLVFWLLDVGLGDFLGPHFSSSW